MIKAATHGKGYENLRYALKNHLPFTTSGALRGTTEKHGTGALNAEEREQFFSDWDKITYVVYSYATPIAWCGADGSVYRVSQKFSPTTSKHQGKLYLLSM